MCASVCVWLWGCLKFLHSFVYLNTRSPASSTLQEGCRTFRRLNLAGESGSLGFGTCLASGPLMNRQLPPILAQCFPIEIEGVPWICQQNEPCLPWIVLCMHFISATRRVQYIVRSVHSSTSIYIHQNVPNEITAQRTSRIEGRTFKAAWSLDAAAAVGSTVLCSFLSEPCLTFEPILLPSGFCSVLFVLLFFSAMQEGLQRGSAFFESTYD